jgi:very-short-patch-repair endonuclease
MRKKISLKDKAVLVGVLKSKADLCILKSEHWYRIPIAYLPKRKFRYVAFYQPVSFGKNGKRIEYYARVSRAKILKRIYLLPKETGHPRAFNKYLKVEFKEILKLPRPVRNIIPRRISFGFTSLYNLLSAKNVLELYGVPPIEKLVEVALIRIGIKTKRELTVSKNGERFRIDLAIINKNGKIAIECDNTKSHRTKRQLKKDKKKDSFLRRNGWKVIRLKEKDIVEDIDVCIDRIERELVNHD